MSFELFEVLQHVPDKTIGWISKIDQKPLSSFNSKFTKTVYSLTIFEPFEFCPDPRRIPTSTVRGIPLVELETDWTTDLLTPRDAYRLTSYDESTLVSSKGSLVDYKEALSIRNKFLAMAGTYWRSTPKTTFANNQMQLLGVLGLEMAELYNKEYPRRTKEFSFNYEAVAS